jgi:outer membrane protein assembly factor BamB
MRMLKGLVAWGLAAIVCVGTPHVAAGNDGKIISDVQAKQAGLTVHWSTQIQFGRQGKLIDAVLVVDENDAISYFELVGGGRREVISDRDIGPNGTILEIKGAELRAQDRKEVIEAELRFRGSEDEVVIQEYKVPQATLFTLTDGGTVQAINAETGKLLWTTQVGNPKYPVIGLGASKDHVAVVRGSRVFCLDAKSGHVLFEHQCSNAVMNSPAVSEETIFVPLNNGALMALPIKSKGAGTLPLNAVGVAYAAPLIAGNFVVWTTDEGYLMVGDKNNVNDYSSSLKYRLKAAGIFISGPVDSSGRLFAATYRGYVYALDDKKGNVLWNFAIGERVSRRLVAFEQSLFVFTDENRLFQFDAATGEPSPGWEEPRQGLAGFIGASKKNFYARDPVGNIVVLDRSTGTELGRVNSNAPFVEIRNSLSDRLYLCTQSGLVQCLRETGSVRPFFHSAAEAEDNVRDPFGSEPGNSKSDNPFGDNTRDDANPFGGSSNEKKKDPNNPFGG